jgi:PKD repeat protein
MAGMTRRRWISLVLVVLSLVGLSGWGAEVVVSADGTGTFRSIQRAIDAARPGDVILIGPGVYEETVTLRSGLTLRGAGVSQTLLRSGYGYDPVLNATSVASVVLEAMAIERSTSMLESTVVELASSSVLFRDCRITGGQTGGVRVAGSSAVTFEGCAVEFNQGFGLQVVGGGAVEVRDSRFESNGAVGIHVSGATVHMQNTEIRRHPWGGLQIEGAASFVGESLRFQENGRWGLHVTGSTLAQLFNSSFSSSGEGSLRVEDEATVSLDGVALEGGRVAGARIGGRAILQGRGVSIDRVDGDGVQIDGDARVEFTKTSVLRGQGHGLVVSDRGELSMTSVTIAQNEGDAVVFEGQSLRVTHSILALNGGAGVRVRGAIGGRLIHSAFNNAWGNGAGDYIGLERPASDLSSPPEFRDVSSGDVSLLPFSACGDGGSYGHAIGSLGNPLWVSTVGLGVQVVRNDSSWGDWVLGVDWDSAGGALRDLRFEWSDHGDVGRWRIVSMWTGAKRLRVEGTIQYAFRDPFPRSLWSVTPSIEATGVLDGVSSRWTVAGTMNAVSPAAEVRWTTRLQSIPVRTEHILDAAFGQVAVSGRWRDGRIVELLARWSQADLWGMLGRTAGVRLMIVPQLCIDLDLRGVVGETDWRLGARVYPTQWGTLLFTGAWTTGAVTASADLRMREGGFEDIDLNVDAGLGAVRLTGRLGASAEQGPRIHLIVAISLDRWLDAPANLPPVPAVEVVPEAPEVGEQIRFDGAGSYDPDGEIDQIWWQFGDGGAASGQIVEHQYANPGTYEVELTVSDDREAVTTLQQTIVVRPADSSPVASFTWAAVSAGGTHLQRPVRAGDRILLDASSARDPDGDILEYHWDLDSDGVFDKVSESPRVVVDPLPVGTWPVTLRVVDDDGFSNAVMRVLSIEPLRPPQTRFDLSPSRPAVGDPVRFVDRSISSDGDLLSWAWEFGDGQSSREREPLHRYEEPGEYVIRLTVRDTEGLSNTAERPISVLMNPELVPIQRVWALLIGISAYEEVDPLDYARRDAEQMAEWLVKHGVPGDQIMLLTDETGSYLTSVDTRLDTRPATLRNVREGLGWLRKVAEPEDLVLIHFSGHGVQGSDDGFDEEDGLDEFFVLHDTRAAAKEDTALRDDEFARFVDRIASEHVVILFDGCYSGGLARSLPSGVPATSGHRDVFNDLRLEGRVVLSASTEDQEAFESHTLQHGVFTHFVLDGLRGAADLNGDGHVTLWELYGYVRDQVPPFVAAERGKVQVPQMIGFGDTRVVLGRVLPDDPPSVFYCPPVPYAGAEIAFRSETSMALQESAFSWSFGDGSSAIGRSVVHTYDLPGQYTVTHEILGEDGVRRDTVLTLDVGAAEILAITEPEEHVLISVGRVHGVRISDQFRLVLSGDTSAHPEDPVLRVIELIDEDTAACRAGEMPLAGSVGERLQPIVRPDRQPCENLP